MELDLSLGFDSIAIKQKKNICDSRLSVDIESEVIKGIFRPTPLIASNMSTVCNADFCIKLHEIGALGILHRADTTANLMAETLKIANNCQNVAVSIGIGKNQFELAESLISNGANIITIDIAHGYCDAVIDLGRAIKQKYPKVKVIVGNTVNIDMLEEVSDFADALKVGIAQGLACETKNTAGCTERQFSAVLKFKEKSKFLGIPIISDGGIREPADMVKAIAAGANSIMAGSIFAKCPESAAEIVEIDGTQRKLYAGMASRHVQDKWKGGLKNGTCPEGKITYLKIGEPVKNLVERYSGALKSGITYAGGKNIRSFQDNVEFVRLI